MTTEDVAAHLHRQLPEFLEGYLVIGRHAGNGELVARYWAPTAESAADMNAVIAAIAEAGGVRFEEEDECPLTKTF